MNIPFNRAAAYTDNGKSALPAIRFDRVQADAIRFFPELVDHLGGDADRFMHSAGVDPATVTQPGSLLKYRSMIGLLEIAAAELQCPSFGMRLAALQGGTRVIGPIGVVMKNSKTVGQALGYCKEHIHAYSLATRVRFRPDRSRHKLFVGVEILLDRLPTSPQVIEHALMLANMSILEISGGAARARQVLFRHQPLSAPEVYREAFGCEVHFGKDGDEFVLDEQDLLRPVIGPDHRVYEMAISYIAERYPSVTLPLPVKVRGLIGWLLGSDSCTGARVATELCMHPRTLQRHLRDTGVTFEGIKDEVRRETALRLLRQPDVPLSRVALKLGYSEQSVLSRSCYRWFSASPKEVREAAFRDFLGEHYVRPQAGAGSARGQANALCQRSP